MRVVLPAEAADGAFLGAGSGCAGAAAFLAPAVAPRTALVVPREAPRLATGLERAIELANEPCAEVEQRARQHAKYEHRGGVDAERDTHAGLPFPRRHVCRRIEVHQLHDTQVIEDADH